MLVKVNNIEGNNVRVTKLDIDDFGSVIPLREVNLRLPQEDESVVQTLRHSVYAILFTVDDNEDDGSDNNLSTEHDTRGTQRRKGKNIASCTGKDR